MVTKLNSLIRRVPARFAVGFTFAQLAASALIAPAFPGGIFAFLLQSIHGLTLSMIGVLFALMALLIFFTSDTLIYFMVSILTFLFALVAAYSAIVLQVTSYQSGILWLGLALFTFWSTPDESEYPHGR